jgi:Icc-related predicted phosphoesterase
MGRSGRAARRGRGGARSRDAERTLFFATDLHGSETCFRKFVAAAAFYRADVLVLGGDLSGKQVVPIVAAGADRWTAEVHGQRRELRTAELDDVERGLRAAGLYPRRMGPDEYGQCVADPARRERIFDEVVATTLRRWVRYAQHRLADTDVVVYSMPGNDDPPVVDDVMRAEADDRFRFVEGEVVEVAPGHEMLTTGYTNVTPWHTHREYPEEEIEARLRSLTGLLASPPTAIFNVHVPPYDSGLDTAPLLGPDLEVRTVAGGQLTGPVGSTAVRAAIEEHQPLLGLHGHIHESGGIVHIGRTTAVNPGSEYGEGILRGVLLTIGGGRLLRHQAVSG